MATTESTWTFERIGGFDRERLLDLWRTLPRPDPAAMEGEFAPGSRRTSPRRSAGS
jgi:hypothetical protein